MNRVRPGRLFLVLASRRAFEAFTGPIPESMRPLFRFQKSTHAARIRALLPDCRLVISKNYRRAACNRWILEARRLGVPTLLLVDGPLEWSNLYLEKGASNQIENRALPLFEPILHDAVASIGEAQKQWIAQKNEGRGIVHMSYANQKIQTTLGSIRTRSETEFDFLLTTAKTPYFNDDEKAALGTTIEACSAALDRAGHRVLVRIFDDPLRKLIRARLPRSTFETSGSFTDALARTRCVIGTPSSVLLEAMVHGRPTGQLMFRDTPLFYQSGWLLGCNGDWEASFRSMLTSDAERIDRQRRTLRENLSDEDFFSHCEEIAAGKRLESPRPIDAADREFEARLLRRRLGWRARLITPFFRSRFPSRHGDP